MIISIYLSAQELPRIIPLSEFVMFSSISGDLTREKFIKASLMASGSKQIANDTNKLVNFINETVLKVGTIPQEYEKGEIILQLLHDSIFNSYNEEQTRIDTVLNNGTFNCVSSAVIFMAVGRAAGLNIQGVRTPDHAFASIHINGNIVDVETTNEWGYDPGKKKEFTDSFSGSTGYNYVPPGNYRLRKDINDKQMIGLILQNRIAELQRINNHKETVPLAVDRYALTLTDDAKKDMYDTFSNYASQLNGSGQYMKGISFLEDAIHRWSSSANVTKAIEALVHNYILSLIEEGKTIDAENFLNELSADGILTLSSVTS
ncbi:MAG: hypothetical protein PF518_10055, partial [Spirochaetaceae bacterium]|nr:hypothetical protein [Spirochaetaceae bacterium]